MRELRECHREQVELVLDQAADQQQLGVVFRYSLVLYEFVEETEERFRDTESGRVGVVDSARGFGLLCDSFSCNGLFLQVGEVGSQILEVVVRTHSLGGNTET